MSKINSSSDFSILDWIGVVYIFMQIMGLFYFPQSAARLRELYNEIGGNLPMLTTLVLKPWFSISLGIVSLSIFSLQWHKSIKLSLRKRRAVVVFSFIFVTTVITVCIIAIYLPIIILASPISS